jgi:membrane dipeptidase
MADSAAPTPAGTIPIWDNHACMPLRPNDETFLPQLERARAAGVTTISLNIGCAEQTPEQHLSVLAWFRVWLKQRPEAYQIIERADDIEAARAAGRLGVFFDIEGARGVGDQISLVDLYYDLGVRWMLIAYNRQNLAGYGCYDDDDQGLTPFGRDLVAAMNRTGMIICCSHTGARTAMETMQLSSKPVIFSHSNCAAVHPHRRNISDDMIRACAAQGGVIGINGIGDFLRSGEGDLVEAYVRHVDHAMQLVGPEHVGVSLDYVFDQQELLDYLESMKHSFPDGLPSSFAMVAPEDLPRIEARLRSLGYDDRALKQIFHESWLRVARANWR